MKQEKIGRLEMLSWLTATIRDYDKRIVRLEQSLSYTKHSKRRDKIQRRIKRQKEYRAIFQDSLNEERFVTE